MDCHAINLFKFVKKEPIEDCSQPMVLVKVKVGSFGQYQLSLPHKIISTGGEYAHFNRRRC